MPQAILQVAPEWFAGMLKSAEVGNTRRYDVVENGLPSDVRVVDVWSDSENIPPHTISILLESAAFPETLPGHDIPMLESPVFRIYYDDLSSAEPPA